MNIGTFIATNKKTLLDATAVAILYSVFGRMLMGSGADDTLLGIIALSIFLLIVARWSITLRGYGVSTVRWVRSAIAAVLGTSLVATAFIVTAMVIKQDKPGHYRGSGSSIVIPGLALFPDTNGELYAIEDSGQNYITVLLTALCIFLSFLMAIVVSTAIGTVAEAKGTRIESITIDAILVALFLFSYLLDVTDSAPDAPWLVVSISVSIVTIISASVMAGVLREEKRPLPVVHPAFAEA